MWECDQAPTRGVRRRGKEGRKMKSDKNFFSCTVSKFFHFGLFVGSQGYSNALEI